MRNGRKIRIVLPYLLITIVFGLGLLNAQWARDDLEHETDVRAATACIQTWEGRVQIRDVGEDAYRRAMNRQAEILASFSADPALIQRYRELIAEGIEIDVRMIREQLPNPECDLERS